MHNIATLQQRPTPFYLYDVALLKQTLKCINDEAGKHDNFHVHYAVKANANPHLLQIVSQAGLGVDAVSGGEIKAALEAGFPAEKIVFAGVGKSDWEINFALDHDIFSFNVESMPELEVINALAAQKGKVANVCLRINPDVDAHTHSYITTGLKENKFGIAHEHMLEAVKQAQQMKNVNLRGLHFHIGSQILNMEAYAVLCQRINGFQDQLEAQGIRLGIINVGGGLGIDYDTPEAHPIPDFANYFDTIACNLQQRPGQEVHFELGRAVVAQCGSLITRVLFIKETETKKFAIVDAGMTELIRPALYGALHKIENLTPATETTENYDVVGPICESSDTFAEDYPLLTAKRGDLLAIRSAGAYGEAMSNQYNCRPHAESLFVEGDETDK